MLKMKDNNLYFNYGDQITLQIACNNATFAPGNYINFHIMEEGSNESVITFSTDPITAETSKIDVKLTSADTRKIMDKSPVSNYKIFWYEVELIDSTSSKNGITLMGYDAKGPKLIYLYPEAVEEDV